MEGGTPTERIAKWILYYLFTVLVCCANRRAPTSTRSISFCVIWVCISSSSSSSCIELFGGELDLALAGHLLIILVEEAGVPEELLEALEEQLGLVHGGRPRVHRRAQVEHRPRRHLLVPGAHARLHPNPAHRDHHRRQLARPRARAARHVEFHFHRVALRGRRNHRARAHREGAHADQGQVEPERAEEAERVFEGGGEARRDQTQDRPSSGAVAIRARLYFGGGVPQPRGEPLDGQGGARVEACGRQRARRQGHQVGHVLPGPRVEGAPENVAVERGHLTQRNRRRLHGHMGHVDFDAGLAALVFEVPQQLLELHREADRRGAVQGGAPDPLEAALLGRGAELDCPAFVGRPRDKGGEGKAAPRPLQDPAQGPESQAELGEAPRDGRDQQKAQSCAGQPARRAARPRKWRLWGLECRVELGATAAAAAAALGRLGSCGGGGGL
mmetsp:Transcript_9978/g.22922  ORF Transcript_9978/g.22922 Transcript_9978/m.22922 type:complete len:444 (+) Transcript_9978:75-1406(+)